MSQRDAYPPGVPCWVETLQRDPGAACAFYAALFGWEASGPGPMPDGGAYFVARKHGGDVAGIGSVLDAAGPAAWTTFVAAPDLDAALAVATDAGASVIAGPLDAPPAGRLAVIADPAGAPLGLWQPGSRRGAERVNEPGAWAMSVLRTPEPARAASFYADAFGWQVEPLGEMALFRLPGYVGGEPHQPVPRDVVAAMIPGDGAPRWEVNFWVSDADRAAESAREGGGDVRVAPYDVPGFRQAVLSDPAGAEFSISQLLM